MAVAVLLLHRPAALLHASFWAEDGWTWYPEAYATGWHALLQPHTGYLQTAARLVALAAQPLPLAGAPTLFAAAAIAIQALPPAFLLSARLDRVWPNVPARLLFALLYVVLPNSFEVSANLTNAQWHFAVLAFLVLIADPARSRAGSAGDAAVLLLSGLSGPFCLFLLPVAVWQVAEQRTRPHAGNAVVVTICCIVQGVLLLTTMSATRSAAPLGADAVTLARIVAVQVLLGALLGVRLTGQLVSTAVWASGVLPILLALGGTLLTLAALRQPASLLRKAALAATALFAAALWHPQVHNTDPQWLVLARPGAGQRYDLIPMLVWLGALLTLAAARPRALRYPARALLLVLPLGIVADWEPPKMPRTDFVARAQAFALAPEGTRAEFPVLPPGSNPMVLVKRGRRAPP